MPLPVVTTSPIRANSGATAVANITTAAFTPPGNSVLVATVHKDGANAITGAATFTNSGTALTWSSIRSQGTGSGGVAIAYAVVPNGGIGSTTVTGTIGTGTNNYAIKVDVVTGVDLANVFGFNNTGQAAGNDLTIAAASTTPQIPGFSLMFIAATGSNVGGSDIPTSASFTDFDGYASSTEMRGGRGYATSNDADAYTILTAGATSYDWSWVALEIRGVQAVTLTAISITHAHPVGIAAVTPGAVTVSPTAGIAHTHPVGTARLDLNLTVTNGIPHTHPVGLATVNPGISPSGISHAHPVGTATVTPGPVSLTIANGIPHTHPMGAVTLLGSVLAPIGIPGGSTVGPATITTGPVNLTVLNGISHSHPMGPAVVTRITTALTTEIVIRPKPRVTYELMVVARIPNAWSLPTFIELEALSWSTLKYGQKLSTPDTLDATVKASTLTEHVKQRLRKPDEIATELWLYRNGKRVFGGPLIGGSMQGENLTLHANGCLAYLQWMHVRGDIVFKNTDRFQIVKRLVDQWGEDTFGNFGIDTSNIGFSGVTMDVTYIRRELNEVYERVMELSKGSYGFDISVDPVNRNLELFYPSKGVDRSEGPEAVVFDDRNVTDTNISFSIGPKDLATVVMATGTGSGQNQANNYIMAYQDSNRLARIGRIGHTATFRDVTSQAQMDRLTYALLSTRSETLWVPGPNVRVTPDADLDSYDVGDTVSYHLHNELDIKGSFRLLARDIDVDENNNESISATFV